MIKNRITVSKAILIFMVFTAYFFLLLFTLLPFLKTNFSINPALYWFITGYFLLIPIFIFAIIMAKKEGNKGLKEIIQALSINSFSKKDWFYSILGLLLVIISTGIIFGMSALLNKYFGILNNCIPGIYLKSFKL